MHSMHQDHDECIHRDYGTRYSHAEYVVIMQHFRQGIPFKWCCPDCSEAATLDASKNGQQKTVLESTRLDSGDDVLSTSAVTRKPGPVRRPRSTRMMATTTKRARDKTTVKIQIGPDCDS